MRHLLLLLGSLLLGSGPGMADAYRYHLEPLEIAEGVWVFEGVTEDFSRANGGNIVNTAFLITEEGVIVFDTGPSRRYGEQMREAIETVTALPITHVFLSHHHPDHVFGNQAFDAEILHALEGTIRLLAEQGDDFADNLYRTLGDWMRGTEVVLPTQVVTPGRVTIGGRAIELLAMSGHSGADLVLFDHSSGVLLAADMVFYQRAPTTPHSPGIDVWREELRELEALDFRYLVPGHGPVVSDRAPFAQMQDYLAWLDDTLRSSAAAGMTASEVMVLPIPPRFDEIAVARHELMRSVVHLYGAYELEAMALISEGG
ncbi:quinoprotein relay system zinc metallohydrolase 1 [Billgrantia kenyensis]|uniref:Quinoprotein relay system zinc metallohydrolase 1 n=1 Tax=Billgrantia kenyensis TaxID=321266 RepID=A0A7V9VZI3_9GAMM|nr:quinoprotein relay system zinc metallohydrolase 1 [Halomonas kenyensis]MBA2778320.1 quinoprotein relay system zinc metallohydrolase 1 [Halomonas kenyensis]MCG6660627.1 quinoprotein relay system zinc metallohydrolase 1 [Halomonas kenyensis]